VPTGAYKSYYQYRSTCRERGQANPQKLTPSCLRIQYGHEIFIRCQKRWIDQRTIRWSWYRKQLRDPVHTPRTREVVQHL